MSCRSLKQSVQSQPDAPLLKGGDCIRGLSQPRMAGPQSHSFNNFIASSPRFGKRANLANDEFRRHQPAAHRLNGSAHADPFDSL